MADTFTLGLLESDFTDNVLRDLGTSITLIKRTRFPDNITGSPTYVEATPITIQGVIVKRNTRYTWPKEGYLELGDAFVMVPFNVDITKEDHVIFDSQRYRVDSVIRRIPGNQKMFKSCNLFKIEDE